MGTFRKELTVTVDGGCGMCDITPSVTEAVLSSGIGDGVVCVFVPHSTAALVLVEHEPGLEGDLKDALERLFPKGIEYAHHLAWNDGNGHSHIRSTFLGASQTVPLHRGRLDLGTWQQIVLVELDESKARRIVIQVVGE